MKKNHILKIILPITTLGVAVLPLVSCSQKIVLTLDAGDGAVIKDSTGRTTTVEIEPKSTWANIKETLPVAIKTDETSEEEFHHWSLTDKGPEIEETYVFEGDETLYAVFVIPTKPITITFDPGEGHIVGGTQDPVDYTTDNKTKWSDMEDKPEAEWGHDGAHEFLHWECNGEEVEDTDIFTQNATVVAVYSTDHKWDGFEVDENNHVYRTCSICGEKQLLTDSELEEHEGDFLYSSNNELVLVDGSQTSLSTFVDSYQGNQVDIYLFSGTYEINVTKSSTFALSLNGLLDSEDNLISHLDCYNNNVDPDWQDKVYHCYGVNLNCNYLYMDGCSMDSSIRTYFCGIQAASIKYTKCIFTGVQSSYTDNMEFNNCLFDATNNVVAGTDTNRTEYSYYVRAVHNITFNSCNFISLGKAIKLFADGDFAFAFSDRYTFVDCEFTYDEQTAAAKNVDNLKAAIEGDAASLRGNHYMHVTTWYTTQSGHMAELESWQNEWGGLIADKIDFLDSHLAAEIHE